MVKLLWLLLLLFAITVISNNLNQRNGEMQAETWNVCAACMVTTTRVAALNAEYRILKVRCYIEKLTCSMWLLLLALKLPYELIADLITDVEFSHLFEVMADFAFIRRSNFIMHSISILFNFLLIFRLVCSENIVVKLELVIQYQLINQPINRSSRSKFVLVRRSGKLLSIYDSHANVKGYL